MICVAIHFLSIHFNNRRCSHNVLDKPEYFNNIKICYEVFCNISIWLQELGIYHDSVMKDRFKF